MKKNHVATLDRLFETVVKGGYCAGCGVCAAVPNSPIIMRLDEFGRFRPFLNAQLNSCDGEVVLPAVCPFADGAPTEDQIAQELFAQTCGYHPAIGYHLATYAGFVRGGDFRERGSSGGMASWILCEMFNRGMIDAVVHVHPHKPAAHDRRLFKYQISTSVDEIRRGAKSRYYPVEMSQVINMIRHNPQTYALVGVPCFIKAVRLMAKEDALIHDRVHFCIGLTCGHLKSARFADMFAWQCGVGPGDVLSIDFRVKMPGGNANNYGVEVISLQNGYEVKCTKLNREFYGYLWGYGFFKYQACDYCDDVFAETADVTLGDAWLPRYIKDTKGTNIVVVRNRLIRELIERGISQNRLHLDDISANEVAKSQDASLRHRGDGLSYRLYLKDKAGEWRPSKRVRAGAEHLDDRLRKIHILRVRMAAESHVAFGQAVNRENFKFFKRRMDRFLRKYNRLYGQRWWKQGASHMMSFARWVRGGIRALKHNIKLNRDRTGDFFSR